MSPESRPPIEKQIGDELLGLPVPLSDAEELKTRVAAADADGVIGEPWERVRERLRHGG